MIARKHVKNAVLLFLGSICFIWAIWQREIMVFPYLTAQWHEMFLGVTWGIVYDFSLLLQAVSLICALITIWCWDYFDESKLSGKISLISFLSLFTGSMCFHEFLLSPNTMSQWNGKFNFFWGIWIPWSVATISVLALEIICVIVIICSVWYWED